ncbi:major facilitator superfamily domain-containing protein 4A-like [Haliotis asinina]|uniref:major facilitator superfamily domain-containing protein 4A-like n=1 Tax=Haliotis asinina TaxID=109174 RepID=UPI0035320726
MIVCVIVISSLVLAIPLCTSFWLAAAATSGTGLVGGVLVTATTAKTGDLSRESALPFHMVALALCTGNVIGALVISPFLNDTVHHGNTSTLEITAYECGDSESNIVYSYLCFASFGAMLAILLTVLRICLDNNTDRVLKEKNKKESFRKVELIFIIFISCLLLLTGATHVVYGSFLLLFGTRSSLKMSEKIIALMTSSYYAVTMCGRLGSVLVSLVISQLWLITACLVGVLTTSVFLVFTAERSLVFLWAGSNVLGLFFAPLFASLIAWAVESVTVNDTVYTIIMFVDYAGISLNSLIVGQLMSAFGPQMLHYCFAVLGGIDITLFLCLICLGKLIQKRKKDGYSDPAGT